MNVLLRFLGAVLTVYMVLIFIRILLTWFSGPSMEGRSVQLLHRMTDPYLNWFRRLAFLQIGRMDYSPIAAVLIIGVGLSIIGRLRAFGTITFGLVLALVVDAAGSAFFFIITLLLILTAIRAFTAFAGTEPSGPLWETIDAMITPVRSLVERRVLRNREVTYRNGLVTTAIVLLALLIIGRAILNMFVNLLGSIPF